MDEVLYFLKRGKQIPAISSFQAKICEKNIILYICPVGQVTLATFNKWQNELQNVWLPTEQMLLAQLQMFRFWAF